jgi:hypothetical protein
MAAVEGFCGVCNSADDITLVVVKRRSGGKTDGKAPLEVARIPSDLRAGKEEPIERNAP